MLQLLLRIVAALWARRRARPEPAPPHELAARLVSAMERHAMVLDRGPSEINIVYLEGADASGAPNGNAPNAFNDRRIVLTFADGRPVIAGNWDATTEPGRRYTMRPVNAGGAARVAFGQYRAWQVGMHRGHHEALVQTGGPVTVCRDANRDFRRDGDRSDTGFFGINQHHGYGAPLSDIGTASAGCLVGRTVAGHRDFMALVTSDPHFRADRRFVFRTAILPVSAIQDRSEESWHDGPMTRR